MTLSKIFTIRIPEWATWITTLGAALVLVWTLLNFLGLRVTTDQETRISALEAEQMSRSSIINTIVVQHVDMQHKLSDIFILECARATTIEKRLVNCP